MTFQPGLVYITDSDSSYELDSAEEQEYTLDSSEVSELSQERRDTEMDQERRNLEEAIDLTFVQAGETLHNRVVTVLESPERTAADDIDMEQVCVFCQEMLFGRAMSVVTPCGHCYHSICIQRMKINGMGCWCKKPIESILSLKL